MAFRTVISVLDLNCLRFNINLAISIEYLKLNNTANIVINKDKNEFMRRFNKYGFGTAVGVPTAATINNYNNGK